MKSILKNLWKFAIVISIMCFIFGSITLIQYTIKHTKNCYEKSMESTIKISTPLNGATKIGPGVIFKKDGNVYYVLTVNHAVSDQTDSIVLTQSNKYSYKIIYSNTNEDIAVIIFISIEKLKVSPLSKHDKRLGDFVYTVGHPLTISFSVTYGHVSNLKQSVFNKYYLQTDCPTNPGNSGGGLFNSNGDLIGIIQSIIIPEDATFYQNTGISLSVDGNYIIDLFDRIGLDYEE